MNNDRMRKKFLEIFQDFLHKLRYGTRHDLIERLKWLAQNPQIAYTPEEIRKAKRLSERITNVKEVELQGIAGEGYEFDIDGKTYGVYAGGVRCVECRYNCVHKLAFAFWLKKRGWKFER